MGIAARLGRSVLAPLFLAAVLAAPGCGDDDDPVSPSDGVIDFPGEASSLREALAAASAGDTVRVGAGTHAIDSTLVFNAARAGVSLVGRAEGSSGERPVLTMAAGNSQYAIAVETGGSNVTIRGLELRGPVAIGIRVREAGCRIADCAIVGVSAYGIYCVFPEANAVIEGNLIVRPGVFGVYCDAGARPHVERNTIYGSGDCGIYVNSAEPVCARNIIARSVNFGVACSGALAPELACNDVFASGGAPYGDCEAGPGDIGADPLFCDTTTFALSEDSPCAPANAGACGGIGAVGTGCPGEQPDHVIDFPGDGLSLQEAIGAAGAGDTIRVAPGSYDLDATLAFGETAAGITLVGRAEGSSEPRPALRLTGAFPRTGIAIDAGASGIVVRGLEIGGALDVGVEVRGTGCRIADCAILRAESSAISCDVGAADPLIEGNLLVRAGLFGVYCASGAHPTVTRNTIYGAGDCGIISSVSEPVCSNNIIAGNANFGIVCAGPVFPTLSCNALFGNGEDYDEGCTPGDGDIHADPLFCDTLAFTIAETSPCAPANAGVCGGMGAGGVACAAPPPDHIFEFPGDGMTLQEAIAAAGPGDTIRVAPGTHDLTASAVFDSSRSGITLVGREEGSAAERPILRMTASGRRVGIWIVPQATGIVVRGLDLRGTISVGINVQGMGCRIVDCAIRRADQDAISCNVGSADPIIEGNLLTWPGIFGVRCGSGARPLIVGNTIYGAADCGIYSYFAQPTCERNIIAASSIYGFVCTGGGLSLSCNALFQNGLSDYSVGCPIGEGDIHVNPLFCDTTSFAISEDSPCAPANAGSCGGMGAPLVGCP